MDDELILDYIINDDDFFITMLLKRETGNGFSEWQWEIMKRNLFHFVHFYFNDYKEMKNVLHVGFIDMESVKNWEEYKKEWG